MEEQDMVHQRELQQKEEYFSGELKRHEQELPEVADRMREPTWELSKTVAQAVWAAEGQSGGESQRRRSTRIKRKHEDQRGRHMKSESEQCGNGKSGYSAIIIILFSHLNAYWSNKKIVKSFFVFFVLPWWKINLPSLALWSTSHSRLSLIISLWFWTALELNPDLIYNLGLMSSVAHSGRMDGWTIRLFIVKKMQICICIVTTKCHSEVNKRTGSVGASL